MGFPKLVSGLLIFCLFGCGPAAEREAVPQVTRDLGPQGQLIAKTLFGAKKQGSAQRPEPIGGYANGCAAGLEQMPETGPTWQAMRLSRNRNWAMPETIDFVQKLSRVAAAQGWAGLYVGDMSQPRGGPMLTGHRSHQTGLDADIWMNPARSMALSSGE
ncbi:MAG: penicillin-insensitive murein endopeptidase, partial [Litoreibacter sp.]|nr:penicillin-insensitive murein endopeptidase [Litoreibacter sp.]